MSYIVTSVRGKCRTRAYKGSCVVVLEMTPSRVQRLHVDLLAKCKQVVQEERINLVECQNALKQVLRAVERESGVWRVYEAELV